jgi:membrane protein YqaA with SNARE-associated domain
LESVTEDLLARFGVYGGTIAVAFIAGIFPIASIELFLVGISVAIAPSFPTQFVGRQLAATSPQVAKTICYFAGEAALERGRVGKKLQEWRPRIEKWNKAPYLVMTLGAAIGLPPLYLLAFIAEPIMKMRFIPFTLIVFTGRLARFIFLAGIPLVL